MVELTEDKFRLILAEELSPLKEEVSKLRTEREELIVHIFGVKEAQGSNGIGCFGQQLKLVKDVDRMKKLFWIGVGIVTTADALIIYIIEHIRGMLK